MDKLNLTPDEIKELEKIEVRRIEIATKKKTILMHARMSTHVRRYNKKFRVMIGETGKTKAHVITYRFVLLLEERAILFRNPWEVEAYKEDLSDNQKHLYVCVIRFVDGHIIQVSKHLKSISNLYGYAYGTLW